MIHEGYLPYQAPSFGFLSIGVHLTVSAGRLPNRIPGEAHLKMNKTRHTIICKSMIHRHWPTDLMSARNWSSTIHTKITEKMRSEPAIVCENMSPAEIATPQKRPLSCWMFFFTKKKGWHLFFGIFTVTFSPNRQKNGQVQRWLLLKGEFWWSSWKVIGVIMMWILGFSSEFDDLSPSSKFLIDFMFQNKITSRGAFQGNTKTKRLISVLLHCGKSGGATINSQCLFWPRNSNLHWPYALRRAPGTPSKCL